MKNRYRSQDIFRLKNRKIFVDTNVLIYLFWPTHTSGERQYGEIYTNLLKQQNELLVDVTVISEMVNRIHRIEYHVYLERNKLNSAQCSYKDYRGSKEGKGVMNDIFTLVKHSILNHFQIAGKFLNKTEIVSLLQDVALDFNDKVLVTLCKEYDLVLLTHDSDFKNMDIEILSTNGKMLQD